ncbi:MAG: SLC13 family permease [Bacteroidota bacterium]|nr:SLC13 family permease [Bacteroidota bacterium]
MLGFDAVIVLVVIIFLIISLYKEIVGPAMTFIIAVIVLGVTKVLEPSEILSGFANEQIAVIIMLLLLGDVFRRSSVLDILFDAVFRKAGSTRNFNARVMFLVAPMSAFLNNTPLVALLMPYVYNRARQTGEYVSKLMIPLSFAAILGGCATLIGTSTNLIVNGLVTDQDIVPNLPALNIFDFAAVGLPMIFIGIFYLLFFGPKLLPERHGGRNELPSVKRRYIVEARIKEGSRWIGKTIEESGLRNMESLYLFEILRNDIRMTAVPKDTILLKEDILLFTGSTDSIAKLVESSKGLEIPSVGMFARKKNTEIIEVVVPHNSTLIHKTLKEVNFRGRFDATAIAVHRNGETLTGQLGQVELHAGDAILLLGGTYFEPRLRETSDLYLISSIKKISRLGFWRTAFLIVGAPLVILGSAFNIISLFNGLLVLLTLSVVFKISDPKDFVQAIDYELAIIIALSLALGTAMMKTGVADIAADTIMVIFKPLGNVGVLTGIYFITSVLAAFITNKAAVAVMFPISLSAATELNADFMPFILVVAYAAAANFMTPIGYQTNLMIFGPGGYKFKDFFKIGTPLTLIYMAVTITILSLIYF